MIEVYKLGRPIKVKRDGVGEYDACVIVERVGARMHLRASGGSKRCARYSRERVRHDISLMMERDGGSSVVSECRDGFQGLCVHIQLWGMERYSDVRI